jgi:hypothetical protein
LSRPTFPGFPRQPRSGPVCRYVRTDIEGAGSGKLKGKKVALKDNVCLVGVPMMNGASMMEGYVPEVDATVVTRILDAGGSIAGKTVCEYFCFRAVAISVPAAPSTTRTAWVIRRATVLRQRRRRRIGRGAPERLSWLARCRVSGTVRTPSDRSATGNGQATALSEPCMHPSAIEFTPAPAHQTECGKTGRYQRQRRRFGYGSRYHNVVYR